jgi:hypothetical protein
MLGDKPELEDRPGSSLVSTACSHCANPSDESSAHQPQQPRLGKLSQSKVFSFCEISLSANKLAAIGYPE